MSTTPKQTHTPGLWTLEEGTNIVTGEYRQQICAVNDFLDSGSANARLIQAAPDLLAALKALHQANAETFEGLPNYLDLWDDAAKAIAKAEGREA